MSNAGPAGGGNGLPNSVAAEHWTTQEQKEYLRKRKDRLYKIQAHELQNDRQLLKSIPGRHYEPWFPHHGILADLSEYLSGDKQEIDAFERRFTDQRWFRAKHYDHELVCLLWHEIANCRM